MPALPIISPSPNVPASKARKASRGSATFTAAFANIATFQAISTVSSAFERTVEREAVLEVGPVPAARGEARLQQLLRDPVAGRRPRSGTCRR